MVLLKPAEADQVRGNHVPVNDIWFEPLKRSAKCRCCGTAIPKGETALRFWWDYTGKGPHFVTKSTMHAEPCRITT